MLVRAPVVTVRLEPWVVLMDSRRIVPALVRPEAAVKVVLPPALDPWTQRVWVPLLPPTATCPTVLLPVSVTV